LHSAAVVIVAFYELYKHVNRGSGIGQTAVHLEASALPLSSRTIVACGFASVCARGRSDTPTITVSLFKYSTRPLLFLSRTLTYDNLTRMRSSLPHSLRAEFLVFTDSNHGIIFALLCCYFLTLISVAFRPPSSLDFCCGEGWPKARQQPQGSSASAI